MDVASANLNLHIQHLVSDYKKTGNEHYLEDAEFIRSEFDRWTMEMTDYYCPPAQL